MHRRTFLSALAASTLPLAGARAANRTIVTADRQHLACLDRGSGAPVVLIHGWSLAAAIWSSQADWLAAQGLRVVAYDRRGHGTSDKPADGYDFDTLAADLAAVLDQLDLRDVTLVGHSMGAGEVARYLARRGTARIARTVLVAPTTPFALWTPDNPDGTDGALYDKMVAALEAAPAGYLAAGAPGLLGRKAEPELVEWALSLAKQASPQALVKCLRALSQTDFRADMQAFTIPTLIITGTGDQPAIVRSSQRSAAAIAGSRIELYEGAPHGLFLTDGERFNRDLLRFIRS